MQFVLGLDLSMYSTNSYIFLFFPISSDILLTINCTYIHCTWKYIEHYIYRVLQRYLSRVTFNFKRASLSAQGNSNFIHSIRTHILFYLYILKLSNLSLTRILYLSLSYNPDERGMSLKIQFLYIRYWQWYKKKNLTNHFRNNQWKILVFDFNFQF